MPLKKHCFETSGMSNAAPVKYKTPQIVNICRGIRRLKKIFNIYVREKLSKQNICIIRF